MTYAAKTTVTVEKSQAELAALVNKYGATGFMSGWQGNRATVMFEMRGRRVRFDLRLPDPSDGEFQRNAKRHLLNQETRERLCDQARRSRWRALVLVVKAKLEAVESGVTTFEEEFMAHLVTASGETVAQLILSNNVLDTGKLPPMLPSGGQA